MLRPWLAAPAILGVLVACGGAPNPPALTTGGTRSAGLAANAAVASLTAVTWSVKEGSAGGSVSTSGLYSAPATVGTYHVVVTAVADTTKTATATAAINGGWVNPGAVSGDVIVFADSSAGAAQISPWIYGMNDAADTGSWGTHPTLRYVTGTRMGGNRMSEYNWENNFSNAGTDYGQLQNDDFFAVGDTTPGAGVRAFLDPIYGRTGTLGNAALVAVPLIGYVSGAWTGYATVPTAASTTAPGAPSVGTGTGQFLTYLTNRPGDSAHALATATPVTTDTAVYEDDFLKWIGGTYPGHNSSSAEPLFISLDGEPDGWGGIHPEVRGGVAPSMTVDSGGDHVWTFTPVTLPFNDLLTRSTAAAKTVKDMLGQGAKVFGPVTAGWANVINLDQTSPPSGYDYFMEWYLAQMQAAGAAAGERLLDVLDMHLYSEATNGGPWDIRNEYAPQTADNILVREQAPRTYWDPAYFELSWITDWGVVPPCGYSCTPQEIPRVEQMITQYYPPFSRSDSDVGTKLGVSEWFFERAGDMSGGIAAADMLGIFGREGVYQASAWPNTSQWAYGYGGSLDTAYACVWAAFSAYLNFDGAGGHFGDMFTPTTVTDAGRPVDWLVTGASRGDGSTFPTQYLERIAAYTSYDASNPGRVVIVAINKSINQDGSLPAALNVGFQVKHTVQLTKANVYRIGLGTPFSASDSNAAGWPAAAAGCTGPTKLNGSAGTPDLTLSATNAFNLSLPSQSITVIVLTP